MMSPITVPAAVGPAAVVCQGKTEAAPAKMMKKFPTEQIPSSEVKTFAGNKSRSGAVKVDAAFQALNEQVPVTRGVNHRRPHADETAAPTRQTRRNNSRNSNGRSSDESVRGNGRKSFESGRRSADSSTNRKSNESQRSSTTETLPNNDDATDQLSQITDILLARLITTLSDSTLGNPALLLQTLLGFSPDDYNDLLAALSESRSSYVDIISAYLHNIKVMSEDSGSTSAALSGTLTRSLIEQYNSLLAQAVKSPQSIARANLGDNEGRNVADMLQRANANENKSERRSFEGALPKGPSGLGFGRRHSADGKQRQQQSLFQSENKPATQPMMDTSLLDLSKLLTSAPKVTVPDLTNCSMAMPQQTGITQEQLAVLLQNTGMMPNNGTQFVQQPAPQPTVSVAVPFAQQPVNNLNGMLAMNNMPNPYAMMQQQPWNMPMQQPQMAAPQMTAPQMTAPQLAAPQLAGAGNRGVMGWQGAATVGFQQPSSLLRGWGGAGLETVPESFSTQLQIDPSCFALNMPHGQQ